MLERQRPKPQYGVYVIGRPLMLVIWGIALWGSAVAARLVWIAATKSLAGAIGLLVWPSVWIPVVMAIVMWVGLVVALRGFRRDGEP